jgi:proteasome accessory factor A
LPPGYEVRLYKNNTDFAGHSYGCHDNYLMTRDIPWDRIVAGLFCRSSSPAKSSPALEKWVSKRKVHRVSLLFFKFRKRADFFRVLVSIDTMNRRPLVNTRDEPHADASRYRRFPRHPRRLEHESNGQPAMKSRCKPHLFSI